MYIVVKL